MSVMSDVLGVPLTAIASGSGCSLQVLAPAHKPVPSLWAFRFHPSRGEWGNLKESRAIGSIR